MPDKLGLPVARDARGLGPSHTADFRNPINYADVLTLTENPFREGCIIRSASAPCHALLEDLPPSPPHLFLIDVVRCLTAVRRHPPIGNIHVFVLSSTIHWVALPSSSDRKRETGRVDGGSTVLTRGSSRHHSVTRTRHCQPMYSISIAAKEATIASPPWSSLPTRTGDGLLHCSTVVLVPRRSYHHANKVRLRIFTFICSPPYHRHST
ncbi:hypothetical protein F5887DRAFT_1159453 [Amanita rubescens]|nr:hypothetical protein F5887DRAFT_1159453 [Amanita rubescens]